MLFEDTNGGYTADSVLKGLVLAAAIGVTATTGEPIPDSVQNLFKEHQDEREISYECLDRKMNFKDQIQLSNGIKANRLLSITNTCEFEVIVFICTRQGDYQPSINSKYCDEKKGSSGNNYYGYTDYVLEEGEIIQFDEYNLQRYIGFGDGPFACRNKPRLRLGSDLVCRY